MLIINFLQSTLHYFDLTNIFRAKNIYRKQQNHQNINNNVETSKEYQTLPTSTTPIIQHNRSYSSKVRKDKTKASKNKFKESGSFSGNPYHSKNGQKIEIIKEEEIEPLVNIINGENFENFSLNHMETNILALSDIN